MNAKNFAGSLCLIMVVLLHVHCAKTSAPSTPKTFRITQSIMVDGRERTFVLNLPPGYYDSANVSLVIAMHGGGGSATQFENTSGLTQKANAAGFAVVYPEGVRSTGLLGARTWNAGGCCEFARDNNINDVKFISQLIDLLTSTYKINPKKVYATGHSNGGMLAYRLACEISGKIAAIAPNGCTMVVNQPCNPARAVPVLHMHSVLDSRVPYKGGIGFTGDYYPPIDSVLQVWSLKNNCTLPRQQVVANSNYTFTKWSGCNNNVSIQYYLTNDGGHGWPGGLPGGPNSETPSTSIDANNLLWEFFSQYQLP